MNKWEILKNMNSGLKARKISAVEALNMLNDALELYVEENVDIECEVFMNELEKLKSLTEKFNMIIEENMMLKNYNEKLLDFARMSDEDLKKHKKYILKML